MGGAVHHGEWPKQKLVQDGSATCMCRARNTTPQFSFILFADKPVLRCETQTRGDKPGPASAEIQPALGTRRHGRGVSSVGSI